MRQKRFKNKVCPRCGCKHPGKKYFSDEELAFLRLSPYINEMFEKYGDMMECPDCGNEYHLYYHYVEFEIERKTVIDKEEYLFILGDKVARFCGQENAMYHSLMYKYIKEKREVYYKEDIEIDFEKILRRVHMARKHLTVIDLKDYADKFTPNHKKKIE